MGLNIEWADFEEAAGGGGNFDQREANMAVYDLCMTASRGGPLPRPPPSPLRAERVWVEGEVVVSGVVEEGDGLPGAKDP